MNQFSTDAIPRRVVVSGMAAFALAAALPEFAFAQSDPMLGTWKLNLAKSTYSPGPPPRSASLTYRPDGPNLRRIAEGADAEGKPTKSEWTHIYDGKPYATPGVADYDTSTYSRVDAHTVNFTRIKAGKLVQAGLIIVSGDGKTLTVVTAGTAANGKHISNTAVYDK